MHICPGLALIEKIRLLSIALGEISLFPISKCFLGSHISIAICIMEVVRVQILNS